MQIKKMLIEIDNNIGVYEVYKTLTVRDAIVFSHISWYKITDKTIKNCWNNSPLFQNVDIMPDSPEKTGVLELQYLLDELPGNINFVLKII
jgi:hypothetical protein